MKIGMTMCGALAALALMAPPAARAQGEQPARDQVQIEKVTAGGVKVTVVEGAEGAPAPAAEAKPAAGPSVVPDASPHKARLAVLPAAFSKHFQPVFKFSEKIESSGQLDLKLVFTAEQESRLEAPSFTLSLAEAFVASRKFDVLERARLGEALKEIDFGESDYADAAKVVPMGKALNAEYVVFPEIEVVQLVEERKDVPYVDAVQPKLKGKMIVRARVVNTASTKIVAASVEDVEVERRPKASNPFLATEINSLILDLYRAAALRVVSRTIEAVYPVRLLEVSGGKAVINRGDGAVAVGDEFEVYTLGKAYVDPDTGEDLGRGETRTALLKVTRVAPKFAEAEIVDGADKLAGDPAGHLCRETTASITAKIKLEEKPVAW